MTAGLPLMKSVLTPFAKVILISLGLSAALSVTDAAIPKTNLWIRNYNSNNFK